MKISAKTEYACVALLELAARYESGEPVRIRKIAERHSVPARFLVQILLQLKGAGIVESTRGAAGGYRLVVPPDSLSLGRVMDIIEGNRDAQEAMVSGASPDSPAVKALIDAWRGVHRKERELLESITFGRLLEDARRYDTAMYYI